MVGGLWWVINFFEKNLKFVFISSCYSEVAGMAFANAGVPHVVAVQWDSPISDKASQTFSKHFYHSLLVIICAI
jgi:hypothetical protein